MASKEDLATMEVQRADTAKDGNTKCCRYTTLIKLVALLILLLGTVTVIALLVLFIRGVNKTSEPEIIIPKMRKIVETRLKFSEGPVFDKNGKFFMVDAYSWDPKNVSGYVLSVDLHTGKISTFCAPKIKGHYGLPIGLAIDKDNSMLVTDVRLGILRIQPNGNYNLVANSDIRGQRLIGCNDLTFDYEGTLWFTTPGPPLAPVPFIPLSKKLIEDTNGKVYGMTRDGSVIEVDSGLRLPNGIAVQHTSDGKPSKLLVANWGPLVIYSYDIIAPGVVRNKQVWGKLQDYPSELDGPDGMRFDEDGFLLVTHWNAQHIGVFGPEGGKPLILIKMPFKMVTNLAFRPNSNEVYVTEMTNNSLWSFNWRAKGAKLWSDL